MLYPIKCKFLWKFKFKNKIWKHSSIWKFYKKIGYLVICKNLFVTIFTFLKFISPWVWWKPFIVTVPALVNPKKWTSVVTILTKFTAIIIIIIGIIFWVIILDFIMSGMIVILIVSFEVNSISQRDVIIQFFLEVNFNYRNLVRKNICKTLTT